MVTQPEQIKPDDIAPPIDIRLVPAAILTGLICLAIPVLPLAWVRLLPILLPIIGGLTMVVLLCIRRMQKQRLFSLALLVAIACWLATPAAFVVQQQRMAAEGSGWLAFIEEFGTARMSAQLATDPVERESPFGPSWYVTVEVDHFGKNLVETNHPAKIVVSADQSWAELRAGDPVCFMGRVTDNQSSVFVSALAAADHGSCADTGNASRTSGRDVMREALRDQAGQTMSYAPELLPGLILGDRSQQSDRVDEAMKIAGLSHLSAVSGAHTSLIAAAATLLFRSLRLPRSVVVAAFLGTLLLFVQLVGMQPSIIRAATMGAIGAWALFFGRGSQALPILALSTIVILSISPELIHEVGFQLSVAATAGIVLGAQPLERWIHGILEKFLPDFWASFLSSSLAISTTAQLACQPILLTFVDYVSLYSLLANLAATPLLPLITVPGTIAAALAVIAPGISQFLLHLVAIPTSGIGLIATTVTDLPAATVPWPDGIAGTFLIILHWLACAIALGKLLRMQRRPKPPVRLDTRVPVWQRLFHVSNRHFGLTNVVQYTVLLIAVVAHLAVLWPTKAVDIDDQWDIIGCDVGQGDMFLIRTGAESAMVIDTGPDDDLAKQCLADANVAHIDVLVVTHLHADHVGGISGVLETADPTEIIYSTGTDPSYTPDGTGLPPEAQQVDAPTVQVIDHNDEQHPVQIRWSVVAADTTASNENDASVVMAVEIYRHGGVVKALFAGDLEEDAATELLAQEIIPDDIDVLKLSHHGARNGGTDLVDHTGPQIALIGVGDDNAYGHPHNDILAALGPTTEIRRTDRDGTFSVTLEQKQTQIVSAR